MTSLTFYQRRDGRGRRRIGDGVFWVHQSKRCRGMRGSISAALCLVSALCLVRAAWSESGAPFDSLEAGPPEVALARVVEIAEPDVVVLSAGRLDGLTDSARVMLLREGDPIVHPLTGKVLGTPQEPVGTVRVFQLQDHSARARLEHAYSTPAVDDLAEFEKSAIADLPAQAAQMDRNMAKPQPFAARVRELEASVEQYEKSSENLKSYPTFARRVWDQFTNMRSRLEALDARLVELEEQQIVDRLQFGSVVRGEYSDHYSDRGDVTREFSVKQIRLSADGKTLLVTAINDSLKLEEIPEYGAGPDEGEDDSDRGFLALLGLQGDDEEGVATPPPGEEPWYKTMWLLVGGVTVLVLGLTVVVALVIRKRYGDVMEGMEEFDDDYLDEEDEEDDDDEDDDDEYKR